MSITFGTVTKFHAETLGGTTHTFNATVDAKPERILLVSVISNYQSVTGVTYDGLALTAVTANDSVGDDKSITWWVLKSPTPGVYPVVVTFSGTGKTCIGAALSVYNCQYTTIGAQEPVYGPVNTSGTGTAVSSSLAGEPESERRIGAMWTASTGAIAVTTGTEQAEFQSGDGQGSAFFGSFASTISSGEAGTTVGPAWSTGTSANYLFSAIQIRPSFYLIPIIAPTTSTSNSTSYSGPSSQPLPNSWVLVFVAKSGSTDVGSVSGYGLTFTNRGGLTTVSTGGILLFTAWSGSSPSSTGITYTCSPAATGAGIFQVNVSAEGLTGVFATDLLVAANSAAPSSSISITLSPRRANDAAVLVMTTSTRSSASATPEANWTEPPGWDTGWSGPVWGVDGEYQASGSDTTATMTTPNTTWGAIAVRISDYLQSSIVVIRANETDTAYALTATIIPGFTVKRADEADTAAALAKLKIAVVARANETDSSSALARRKITATARANETDSASSRAVVKALATGRANEADTAFARAAIHVRPIDRANEADTASARPIVKAHLPGLAIETDTASARSVIEFVSVLRANETDTALTCAVARAVAVGRATETDTASARAVLRAATTGRANETDSASALAAKKFFALGRSTEADAAFALVLSGARQIGYAMEVDTAFALHVLYSRATGRANETDTAAALALAHTRATSLATETDAASALVAVKRHTQSTLATEADAASALRLARAFTAGRANETDTATARPISAQATIGRATEHDTALTLGFTGMRHIEMATETDTASALSIGFALPVRAASEMDTAAALVVGKFLVLGLATETDEAFAPVFGLPPVYVVSAAYEVDTAFAPRLAVPAPFPPPIICAPLPGSVVVRMAPLSQTLVVIPPIGTVIPGTGVVCPPLVGTTTVSIEERP